MNTKHLLSAALFAVASVSSVSAFAGNELSEEPQAQSTLTREQVKADTLAAQKRGELRRTSYDEQESVVISRDHQLSGAAPTGATRAQVKAETNAFFKAHPESEYERNVYGVAG